MIFLDENLKALDQNQPALAEELRRQEPAAQIEMSGMDETLPNLDAILIAGLPAPDCWPRILAGKTPYVIIAHNSIPELKSYFSVVDLTRPILDHRLCFAVGDEGVLQLLNDLFGTLYRRKVTLFGHEDLPGYAAAMKEMQFFDTLCAANRATLDQFAEEWQNHLSDNIPDFLSGPFLQEEAGRWRGGEAAIVAAGPSLDEADLPADFGTAAVVACDTAVPVLASKDVVPDVIVTLDSSESNRTYLENLPAAIYEKSVLCVTPVVDGRVYRPFRNVLFYSYGHPTLDHLRESGLPFAPLASGGSVALTALDAVRHFGARRAYLLGFDFQYQPHKTHARGTGAAFRALGSISRFRSVEQAGYESSKDSSPDPELAPWSAGPGGALTDKKLQKWRDWLELYVKNHDLEVLQMSRKSAPIPGVGFGKPGRDRTTGPFKMERRELSADMRRELKFMSKEMEMALSAPSEELVRRVKALPRVGKCMGYILAWLADKPPETAAESIRGVIARLHAGVTSATRAAQGR